MSHSHHHGQHMHHEATKQELHQGGCCGHGHAKPGKESPYPMMAVSKALEIIFNHTPTLPTAQVKLEDSIGLVLAEDVLAADPLPPFPASMKDGYAVNAADTPGTFLLHGDVHAGKMPGFVLEPKAACRITTGAALPQGANAVVMIEYTEEVEVNGVKHVKLPQVKPGADVRPVASDIAKGELILKAGERLGPAEIGLLATVGASHVTVRPQPRVGVLSTGDELVLHGQNPGAGQIRDSNRPMLIAGLQSCFTRCGVVDLGIAPDLEAELVKKISDSLALVDVLVTTGGVSMGDLDLVKPILERQGQVHFGRVLMKPGKPLTFATVEVAGRQRLVFGLPGNPVSSLVCFYLFVVPCIRKMSGASQVDLPRVRVKLSQSLQLDSERPEFHRATVRYDSQTGELVAFSTGNQLSSRLLSMRTANALLLLPQRKGTIEKGDTVEAMLIGSLE